MENTHKSRTEDTDRRSAYAALGLPDETIALLHDYLSACSNLYGICKVRRVLRLFNKQNPPIEREPFLQFIDIVRKEHRFYSVLGQEELFEDAEPTAPIDREVIAEHLIIDGPEDYLDLKDEQANKPFYIPNKEELLRYTDECYVEPTRQYIALHDFMAGLKGVDKEAAAEFMIDLSFELRHFFPSTNAAVDLFQKYAKRSFRTKAEVEIFVSLWQAFANHLRVPQNRGFTPNEIYNRMK